jgi:putative colanic acid biosynthesis glycosyltransferase WcaI
VITRIVEELVVRGHSIDVITTLPWYLHHRVEPGFEGRMFRYEDTPWGHITRINPFAVSDKSKLLQRAGAFAAFSAVAAVFAARGGRVDGVLAVSPPLTLGVSGWIAARRRRSPLVFNVQDIYPDVVVELGAMRPGPLLTATSKLELFCYERADAVTVLSEDLKVNVASKIGDANKVRVIPNFVDIDAIRPRPHDNSYRQEFGLRGKLVVMYAGNVGFSQALTPMLEAAAALTDEPDVTFVINGGGVARPALERAARGLPNVRFVDMQPAGRLPEVLAAADIHLVPLKRGLAHASVPSKTYSILAAGRPLLASVDPNSEVARLVQREGCGVAVPPEDAESLTKAIRRLIQSPEAMRTMGQAARRFVEDWVSPSAVAQAYEELFEELEARRGGGSH